MHDPVMNLLFCLLLLSSSCLARLISPSPAWGPSYPPELWNTKHLGPSQAPALSPRYHGSVASSPVTKHHRRIPRAASPTSFPPPQGKDDCDGVSCSEPLTRTAFGSPCGCVIPMQVVIDFGIAPYLLFTQVQELAIEVAAGTFLKQSQVQIIGADASIYDQEKTTVTIYLVPLGNTFDSTTALLIYERIWQKKVPIDGHIFGDYEVINVHYPGLPSSPPSEPGQSSDFGPSGTGSQQYPFSANVPPGISQKLNSGIIAVIVLSSSILLLVCLGVVFIILKWAKLGRTASVVGPAITPSTTKRSGMKSLISSSMLSSASVSFVSTLPTCSPSIKTFSLAELEKATENFSCNKILGEGGFGCVYHAIMEDGSEAAVKLLTTMDQNKDREFIAEVEMLSRLHHRNLVKLIGICIEGSKRCLVYEIVRNGSVESHLHGVDKKKGPLDRDARMKIALGAARGLAYLHEDSNPRVIHRDFKGSNILLGDDFTPKVSDFGLAREASDVSHHISTRVMGTFGYVAPEYAMTGHLLVKSDVYSYGVVLLELLSGRKPVYMSQPRGPENLVTWARPLLSSKEGVERLIDPSLSVSSYNFDDVAKVAAIASMCVSAEAPQRPFMGEVVQALKLIYNDTDDPVEDSNSHRDSSDFDYREEGNWWSRSTPRFVYGNASPFATMEYSSDAAEETRRPHSASDLAADNRSGPLRMKRKKLSFYKLRRGSMSEHGHLSRRRAMN